MKFELTLESEAIKTQVSRIMTPKSYGVEESMSENDYRISDEMLGVMKPESFVTINGPVRKIETQKLWYRNLGH